MDNSLREVNDYLMKELFLFREESKFCYLTEDDKKHFIHCKRKKALLGFFSTCRYSICQEY